MYGRSTPAPDHGPPGPTALYRYFDAQDVLLYVGISAYAGARFRGHAKRSPWMDCAVRSTITRYPTREEARTAEIEAIRTERPVFNVADNETPGATKRRREYERAHPEVFAPPKPKPPRPTALRPQPIPADSDGFEGRPQVNPGHDYFAISRGTVRDARLSYCARGVLAALLSLSPGDVTDPGTLADDSPDEQDVIEAALAELRAAGYTDEARSDDGHLHLTVRDRCDPPRRAAG